VAHTDSGASRAEYVRRMVGCVRLCSIHGDIRRAMSVPGAAVRHGVIHGTWWGQLAGVRGLHVVAR
jgi:hypothetical protein